MAEPQGGGTLQTTPPLAIFVAALFGGLTAWLIVVVARAMGTSPPQVPWTAPVAVILIALGVGVLAWQTYQRIHRLRLRMDPQRAVSFLVLGKASALGGGLVGGGYLVYALMFLARIDGESPRERVILSLIAVAGGAGLTIAGLLLERACKVPKGGSGKDAETDSEQRGEPVEPGD